MTDLNKSHQAWKGSFKKDFFKVVVMLELLICSKIVD